MRTLLEMALESHRVIARIEWACQRLQVRNADQSQIFSCTDSVASFAHYYILHLLIILHFWCWKPVSRNLSIVEGAGVSTSWPEQGIEYLWNGIQVRFDSQDVAVGDGVSIHLFLWCCHTCYPYSISLHLVYDVVEGFAN